MYKGKNPHKVITGSGMLAFVLVITLVTGCSTGFVPQERGAVPQVSPPSNENGPTNGNVQSNSEGAVTIDVEWLGEEGGNLLLEVAMNTHSVDLDGYDLEKLAMLRDDTGKQYSPASWVSQAGGHHRQGILTFNMPGSQEEQPEYIDLIIRDVAGVKERVFRWELNAS